MNKFLTFSTSTILLLAAFFIAGCSSSDDGVAGGGTTAADITAVNMEALATAGTEGVKQAVNSNSVPLSFAKVSKASPVQSLTVSLAQTASQDPKFVIEDFSSICNGGGTATADGNESNVTITFINCIIGGIVMNGTVNVTTTVSGNTTTIALNYTNFSVTFDGKTETFDLQATCTNTDNGDGTFTSSCTFDSEALGIDGRTYTVSDISVSGDSLTGYTVSATITDPDHGIITMTTTTPVTFNCTNGQPDAGVIVVSDGTDTMTITYIDCNSFSIDFDGSTTTFSW